MWLERFKTELDSADSVIEIYRNFSAGHSPGDIHGHRFKDIPRRKFTLKITLLI